ncbi:MAG: zinc-dependent metalloprotease [Dactylosporangium sp.]|nr:zinc-dependent metalloprotease [Dactylosporangium sp.]NNJ63093.1 zinc-dependent metalloprotease [Dactylosporangium sp.]
MEQFQRLFAASSGGPVNWDLAVDIARARLTGDQPQQGLLGFPLGGLPITRAAQPPGGSAEDPPAAPVGDPAVEPADLASVIEALRLADLWLEAESTLPSGLRTATAWSRGQWLTETLAVWRKLCDPVAARMASAMTGLVPEQAREQFGGISSVVASLGGTLFGGQLGTALGSLAAEVLSAGDIGLPLGPAGTAALVPANIQAYGEGLEISGDQVRLYVALREAAHQRLFGHVPWLRGHVFAAVEAYAAGIHVDREAIEQALAGIDPAAFGSEPLEINLEGIFTPEDTPQQKAALSRLETALALIEGWVCHIVDRAAGQRLPDVARLSETFRRRRATGGPAEQLFATLVGLELRPRRLREATALWSALREHRGAAGRDGLWGHPDLMPDAEAFADPEAFAKSRLDLTDLGFDL